MSEVCRKTAPEKSIGIHRDNFKHRLSDRHFSILQSMVLSSH